VNANYKPVTKIVVATLCVLAVVWAVCSVALYHVMQRPPERFGQVMARLPEPVAFLVLPFETLWMHARAGTLQVGDAAPDFTLAKLDKSEQIRLSSFAARNKPVVLIFGSYT
jgi:hypothetical protein